MYLGFIFLVLLDPIFDSTDKINSGLILPMFSLKLFLQIFKVLKSGLHFCNLVFSRIELIPNNIGFL